jgi:hypothetical protein
LTGSAEIATIEVMSKSCTLVSIDDSDVSMQVTPDTSLPGYDSDVSSKIQTLAPNQLLPLGEMWTELHEVWGDPPADHPLGFLAAGGEPLPALADGRRSSGRYFAPAIVARIVAALGDASMAMRPGVVRRVFRRARTANPEVQVAFDRVSAFLATAVADGRGVIVHLFDAH